MSENIVVDPFVGTKYEMQYDVDAEEYDVEDTCDDGLIYRVKYNDEEFHVVIYTTSAWPVQGRSGSSEYVFTWTDGGFSKRYTSEYRPKTAFTHEDVYKPFDDFEEGFVPEVLYFSDAVVDVLELVGLAYTRSYTSVYFPTESMDTSYYGTRTLAEHRNLWNRDDATLAGKTNTNGAPILERSQLSQEGHFPDRFYLYQGSVFTKENSVVELTRYDAIENTVGDLE